MEVFIAEMNTTIKNRKVNVNADPAEQTDEELLLFTDQD